MTRNEQLTYIFEQSFGFRDDLKRFTYKMVQLDTQVQIGVVLTVDDSKEA